MLKHFQSPGDSCRNKKHGKMRNNLFECRRCWLAAVLLTTAFWSCSKDEDPEPTPPIVSVTGVTLNKTGITLEVDGSETLTATVAPDNATNKKVTWKSDKPEIATVDASGKITGVKEGEATITVTTEDGGKTATCKVSVLPSVKKVTVEPATLTLGKKKSYTLKATVEVSGSGTDTGVTWTSSDETIATVDATGTVTATDKVGTVTITATSVVDPHQEGHLHRHGVDRSSRYRVRWIRSGGKLVNEPFNSKIAI